jgi:hypothetical protein
VRTTRDDPIEIKINIAGDVDTTLQTLGLDRQPGRSGEIWFLDDTTEGARPALPLLTSGIILRLRRPRTHGEEENSTVKLRPCRRSQLVGEWQNPLHKDDKAVKYRIEGDWSSKRRVLAASCVTDRKPGSISRALGAHGCVSDLFSKRQRDFLSACTDIRLTIDGMTALGPIASTRWRNIDLADVKDVAAERWTAAGLDLLELSIRTEAGADAAALRQKLLEKEVLARGLQFDESEEPKTERVLKRLAGLDMSSESELLAAATSPYR